MAKAARKGDTTSGTFSEEHHGHTPPGPVHSSGASSGVIISGSNNVLINNQPAVKRDDSVQSNDICGTDTDGKIDTGSATVFINGESAARKGDKIKTPYDSNIEITGSCSDNVEIGD